MGSLKGTNNSVLAEEAAVDKTKTQRGRRETELTSGTAKLFLRIGPEGQLYHNYRVEYGVVSQNKTTNSTRHPFLSRFYIRRHYFLVSSSRLITE